MRKIQGLMGVKMGGDMGKYLLERGQGVGKIQKEKHIILIGNGLNNFWTF